MTEPTLTEVLDHIRDRLGRNAEAAQRQAATVHVLTAYDLQRARGAYDMTAGRRRRRLEREARRLEELERLVAGDATVFGGRPEFSDRELAGYTRNAFDALVASLVKPDGVTDAVVVALEATREVLGLPRPPKLERALNGASPIFKSGGSRRGGRSPREV